jgi:hypothetical protein
MLSSLPDSSVLDMDGFQDLLTQLTREPQQPTDTWIALAKDMQVSSRDLHSIKPFPSTFLPYL